MGHQPQPFGDPFRKGLQFRSTPTGDGVGDCKANLQIIREGSMDVPLGRLSRRKFILASGGIVGATTLLSETPHKLMAGSQSLPAHSGEQASSSGPPLYNADVQTAIGLGDELASIVDRFGQVRSRRAEVRLELGTPPRPVSGCEWSQSLENGYLP